MADLKVNSVTPVLGTERTVGVPEIAFSAADTGVPPQQQPSAGVRGEALHAYAEAQKPEPRHLLTRVDELMSREVLTLPLSMTIIEAWQMLAERGLGQAPVVNERNRVVGLLTRAELLLPERLPSPESNALVWRAFLQQGVGDIMLSPLPSVPPDTDIRQVARMLLDAGLPGLPVVDEGGQLLGFISRADILRAVATEPPLDLWG